MQALTIGTMTTDEKVACTIKQSVQLIEALYRYVQQGYLVVLLRWYDNEGFDLGPYSDLPNKPHWRVIELVDRTEDELELSLLFAMNQILGL
jgi:hypothetical protein